MTETRTYVCPKGCCEVTVEGRRKQGCRQAVTINGERSTYNENAARLSLPPDTLRTRVSVGQCVQARPRKMPPRPVSTGPDSSAVAAAFLRLPRPPIHLGDA